MFERRVRGGADFPIPTIRIGGMAVMVCLAVSLAACKSDDEQTAGLGAPPTAAPVFTSRTEPALAVPTDGTARKYFINGLRSLRLRDFSHASGLFREADRRHRLRSASPDEFVHGCTYYLGRCQEGLFAFEEAKATYEQVPQTSAYRPAAAQRFAALTLDADGDGYSDAWEDAEGTNPQNPLSHP